MIDAYSIAKPFSRNYAGSLDADYMQQTIAAMTACMAKSNCHVGQQFAVYGETDPEDNGIYEVYEENNTKHYRKVGSDKIFVVDVTGSNNSYTASKSTLEIIGAYQRDKIIFVRCSDWILPLASANVSGSAANGYTGDFTFAAIAKINDNFIVRTVDIDNLSSTAEQQIETVSVTDDNLADSETMSGLSDRIGVVEGKIPAAASSSNQLADKDFVNSSISTATATFRGTFTIDNDLHLDTDATHAQVAAALNGQYGPQTKDNQDYVYVEYRVQDRTDRGNYDRYKYNGTTWAYEYTINNSGLTAAQWAAINSGITATHVTEIGNLRTDVTNMQNNAFADASISTADDKVTIAFKNASATQKDSVDIPLATTTKAGLLAPSEKTFVADPTAQGITAKTESNATVNMQSVIAKLITYPDVKSPTAAFSMPSADLNVEVGTYVYEVGNNYHVQAVMVLNGSAGIAATGHSLKLKVGNEQKSDLSSQLSTLSGNTLDADLSSVNLKLDDTFGGTKDGTPYTLDAVLAYQGNTVNVNDNLGLGTTKQVTVEAGTLNVKRNIRTYRDIFYSANRTVGSGSTYQQEVAALCNQASAGYSIRALNHLGNDVGKFQITVPAGAKCAVIFVPMYHDVSIKNLGTGYEEADVWKIGGLDTNQAKTANVNGKNDYTAATYNCYYVGCNDANGFAVASKYEVTITRSES